MSTVPRPSTMPKSLAELSTVVPGLHVPDIDVSITGVAMDSNKVQAGDLYLAIAGARVHGAEFATAATKAGAVAILTDEQGAAIIAAAAETTAPAAETTAPATVPILVVDQPRNNAGDIASWVYDHPARDLRVIGITGTNGKTTTSFLLEAAFRGAGEVTGVIGTTGHYVAGTRLPSAHTTPEAVEVHALLAYMRQQGVTTVIMEVSSHALTFGRVKAVQYDLGIFTNLTQDHLDFHGSMAAYFDAKATLFDQCALALLCIDDDWGQTLESKLRNTWQDQHRRVHSYGFTDQSDWQCHNPSSQDDTPGSIFTVTTPAPLPPSLTRLTTLQVQLPGAFNIANATAAFAAACMCGVDPEAARRGIAACTGVPGRMQPVPGKTLLGFVDYAHTPDAVARAIGAVPGRATVVLGCGGDRDREKRPLMGEVAAQLAHVLIVTDDNPRSEDPQAIRAAVLAGTWRVAADQRAQVHNIGDRREAIAAAVALTEPGNPILVLGKGHEQGQIVGTQMLPFDDVVELQRALQEAHK